MFMTILAVFRSRAQTLGYLTELRAAGIPAQAVSTPKEAGVGCGISAKFEETFFERAKRVLAKRAYSAFAGFLRVRGGRYERA